MGNALAGCRGAVLSPGWVTLALAGGAVAIFAVTNFLSRPEAVSAQGEGPLLFLYSEEDFGGRCLEVRGTLLDLPREESEDGCVFDWNDNVRSLKVVSGTWRLCQHGRLNTLIDEQALAEVNVAEKFRGTGWACIVSAGSNGPAEHRSAAGWGWAPGEISSVELLSAESLPDWAIQPLPGQ